MRAANCDIEQEHRQFKRAVDQALRARGSRDFADRAAYNRFLQNLVKQRNLRRQTRDLFPSLVFRRAYDDLQGQTPERADRHYVRVLHLAASTSECEVEAALTRLLDQHVTPTFDAVRDLVRGPADKRVPELGTPVFDFNPYVRLFGREATTHG